MKKLVMMSITLLMVHSVMAQNFLTRSGKITFNCSTPLEKIIAINNEVTSVLNASTGEMAFSVPIKSFKFERQLMQEHFNENYMESDKYPRADFKGKVMDMSGVHVEKDGVYQVKSEGKLSIHGVSKNITVPGTITVKGGTVTLASKFSVVPQDYNISIPKLVADKIAQTVDITVNTPLSAKK